MSGDEPGAAPVAQARQLVSRSFGIPEDQIDVDTRLADLKEFDSLAMEEILMELESVAGRPITPDEILGLETTSDIARLIEGSPVA